MESGGHTPLTSMPATRTATPSTASNGNGNGNGNGINGVKQTKICVFCGSSPGHNPVHMEAARELGRAMHKHNIGLVYGGGTIGLMGEVARTLVSLSGPDAVHGIIPEALVKYERDPAYTTSASHDGLAVPDEKTYGRTTVVKDMHTRKQLMAQEVVAGGPGSGFVALPGGYGTLEELLETCTWNQLGIHDKGVCVLNVDGFYDGILQWIGKSMNEGFIRRGQVEILKSAATPEEAIAALRDYKVSDSVLKLTWGNE